MLAGISKQFPKTKPLNNPHNQLLPYLRRSNSRQSSPPYKCFSTPSGNKSTDGSDTPLVKTANSGEHFCRSQPVPVEADEPHSPPHLQLHCKQAHVNLPTLAPQAGTADGVTPRVIAVLPISFHANDLNRVAYAPNQISIQALPRTSVQRQEGNQSKSVESRSKRIQFNEPINHTNTHR